MPKRHASDPLLETRITASVVDRSDGVEARRALWFRPRTAMMGPAWNRYVALALASDMRLVHTTLLPHGDAAGEPLEAASLDHAIWFHRSPPAAGWLVHCQHGPVASNGRGWSRGHIFARDGTLIATTAQEMLMRRARPS